MNRARVPLNSLVALLDHGSRELAAHARHYGEQNDRFEAFLRERNHGKLPPMLLTDAPWPFTSSPRYYPRGDKPL